MSTISRGFGKGLPRPACGGNMCLVATCVPDGEDVPA
jgi:hypothetical protein